MSISEYHSTQFCSCCPRYVGSSLFQPLRICYQAEFSMDLRFPLSWLEGSSIKLFGTFLYKCDEPKEKSFTLRLSPGMPVIQNTRENINYAV